MISFAQHTACFDPDRTYVCELLGSFVSVFTRVDNINCRLTRVRFVRLANLVYTKKNEFIHFLLHCMIRIVTFVTYLICRTHI